MRKRFINYTILLAVTLPLLFSCSVKNEREHCPCYLYLSSTFGKDCLVSVWNESGNLVAQRVVPAEELAGGNVPVKVPRERIRVTAAASYTGMQIKDNNLICAPEQESAELYACGEGVDCYYENAKAVLVPQKQHARITVMFRGEFPDGFPYKLRVTTGTNAYSLKTLESVGVPYSFSPEIGEDNQCSFFLCRQTEGSAITLSLSAEGGSPASVPASGEINLAGLLSAAGYSWKVDWLGDITVEVDINNARITLYVEGWKEGRTFNFVL